MRQLCLTRQTVFQSGYIDLYPCLRCACFSTSWPAFGITRCLHFCQSIGCKMPMISFWISLMRMSIFLLVYFPFEFPLLWNSCLYALFFLILALFQLVYLWFFSEIYHFLCFLIRKAFPFLQWIALQFYLLCLSLIHLNLTLVNTIREKFYLIFSIWNNQLSWSHLVEHPQGPRLKRSFHTCIGPGLGSHFHSIVRFVHP